MIHKVGTNGTAGSIQQAINYVLGEKDHNNEIRAGVILLEGDPVTMTDLEQTMKTKNTYVHTSLSFTAKETEMINANPEILENILSSYKEQLAAGLPGADASRLASLIVRHDEADGKMHIHMITLRQDLETGKSYQPFVSQRGDIARFKDWNVVMQNEYGLENPNSKEHQKTAVWSKNLPKKVEAVRGAIDSKISDMVSSNQIQNRQQVIKFINNTEHMKVARMTPNFISVKVDGHKRNIKLLGAIYAKSFTSTQSVRQSMEQRAEVNVEQSEQRLSESMSNLAKASHHKYEKNPLDVGLDTTNNINTTIDKRDGLDMGSTRGHDKSIQDTGGRLSMGKSVKDRDEQRPDMGTTEREKIKTPDHRIFNNVQYNKNDKAWSWQGSYGYVHVQATDTGYTLQHGSKMEWTMAAQLLKDQGATDAHITCSNEQSMIRALMAHKEAGVLITGIKIDGKQLSNEEIKSRLQDHDTATKITRNITIDRRVSKEGQTGSDISNIIKRATENNQSLEQQSSTLEQASKSVKQLIDTIESELERQRYEDEQEYESTLSL